MSIPHVLLEWCFLGFEELKVGILSGRISLVFPVSWDGISLIEHGCWNCCALLKLDCMPTAYCDILCWRSLWFIGKLSRYNSLGLSVWENGIPLVELAWWRRPMLFESDCMPTPYEGILVWAFLGYKEVTPGVLPAQVKGISLGVDETAGYVVVSGNWILLSQWIGRFAKCDGVLFWQSDWNSRVSSWISLRYEGNPSGASKRWKSLLWLNSILQRDEISSPYLPLLCFSRVVTPIWLGGCVSHVKSICHEVCQFRLAHLSLPPRVISVTNYKQNFLSALRAWKFSFRPFDTRVQRHWTKDVEKKYKRKCEFKIKILFAFVWAKRIRTYFRILVLSGSYIGMHAWRQRVRFFSRFSLHALHNLICN